MVLGKWGRGETLGDKLNNKSHVYSCLGMPSPGPLVWLVVEFNDFCCLWLENSAVIAQFRLNIWGHSALFYIFVISLWVSTIPCTLLAALFVGFSNSLLLFWPFIMLFGWIVHVHTIKCTFHIFCGRRHHYWPLQVILSLDFLMLQYSRLAIT